MCGRGELKFAYVFVFTAPHHLEDLWGFCMSFCLNKQTKIVT